MAVSPPQVVPSRNNDWGIEQAQKIASSNQKHYIDQGSNTSSVWNFCARFSDVISAGNQWWRHEMLAVISGYLLAVLNRYFLVINCSQLITPHKGILLTVPCKRSYRSNCSYSCQPGYASLIGNVTRTCLSSGKWSGSSIKCTGSTLTTIILNINNNNSNLYWEYLLHSQVLCKRVRLLHYKYFALMQ